MGPAISILTPAYNGERYLAECIESVRAQTLSDWEYIIVDNCSKDRTAEVAERYAAIDSRIRVVRCTEFVNAHRSFSRTVGYMHPGSRYCKFVSADDTILPQCLEKMVAVMQRHPTVGMVSAYRMYGEQVSAEHPMSGTEEFLAGREAVRRALLEGRYVTGAPTSVLFTAQVVRQHRPFFDQTVWHSDTDAGLRTLLATDLGFVHEVLTHSRVHADALTQSFANRINTYLTLFVDAIVRYGPQVLAPAEYRRAIRIRLRQYWWFLFKAGLQRSRRRDSRFQAYHNSQLLRMLEELPQGDRETRLVLKSMRWLLADREQVFANP